MLVWRFESRDKRRESPRHSVTLRLLLVPALAVLLISGGLFASGGDLVEVEFVSPDRQRPNPKFDDLLPLVVTSGWHLGLKLKAPDALGIGQAVEISPFPVLQNTAYVVFDDPDGCFSPTCSVFGPMACGLGFDAVCPPPDETMFEFTLDGDSLGEPDSPNTGNPDVQALLMGPSPILKVFDGGLGEMGTNTREREIGPERNIDPSLLDGYGPGPDDDLPGLVLLIDSGFGLIYDAEDLDQDGDILEVRGARNLAGFLNQVGYTLSSSRHGGVNVLAQMLVPRELTGAQILRDDAVGPDGCFGDMTLIRVNGGSPITLPSATIPDGLDVPFDPTITVRAFLVNGIAPAGLQDLNGDGVFDSADAALDGYEILSNEAAMEVIQYHQSLTDLLVPLPFDIDGNGFAVCDAPVAPGGPGTVTPPPR